MTEYRLYRLRPRLTRLWLPTMVLFVASAILTFFGDKQLLEWETNAMYIGVALGLALFWLIPSLKYLGTFVDVTSLGIRARRGIFGGKTREVSFTDIEEVVYSRTRGVVVRVRDQEDLDIRGLSTPKAVADELSRLAK